MKTSFTIFPLAVLMVFLSGSLFAQKGVEDESRYGHGEDSITCIKNLSLYREFVKYDNYKDAWEPWLLVFDDCPRATKNIYIDGAKMVNDRIDREKDPVRKAELMDTLRLVYDQRIRYYKQEGSVLGRKGVDILRHPEYRTDPDINEECYGYLGNSLKILGKKSSLAVVATYMSSSLKMYQDGRITDIRAIEDYALISEIVDYQFSQKPGDEQILKVKDAHDANFINSGAPTCESMLKYLKPQFETKKDDVDYLRKAVSFLSQLECESDPFYARVAEKLYANEPSAAAAYGLAKLFLTNEDYKKAMDYYREAIGREENPMKKADYYYQLAFIISAKMNEPEMARGNALEAIKLRPDWGEPYLLIGDIYAGAKDCFDDEFEKTTIFWAAVDKFIRAKTVDPSVTEKANERISTYSKYFPDVETVFFYSLKEGDSYTVGCWINETTKVRPR